MQRLTRPLVAVLGLALTAVGAVGLLVPLLPTTPFLLLAALCFSRSSPRLHGWLLASPLLGRLVSDWERHGAIRPRAKWACTVLLVGFVAWPLATGRVPSVLVPVVLVTVVAVMVFVWSRPSGPAVEDAESERAAECTPDADDGPTDERHPGQREQGLPPEEVPSSR